MCANFSFLHKSSKRKNQAKIQKLSLSDVQSADAFREEKIDRYEHCSWFILAE